MVNRRRLRYLRRHFEWLAEVSRSCKLVMIALSLLSFGVSLTSNALPILLKQQGYQELGWIMGSFSAGAVVFYLLGGILTDRNGGKKVATLGLPTMLIASVVIGYMDSHFEYVTIRVIHGFSYAVVFPPLYALLSEHLPQAQQVDDDVRIQQMLHLNRRTHSLSNGAECLAGALGYALGLLLLKNGLVLAWSAVAGIVVCVALVLVLFVPSSTSIERVPLQQVLHGQRRVFRVTSITIGITFGLRVTLTYGAFAIGGFAGLLVIAINTIHVLTSTWIPDQAEKRGDYHLLRLAVFGSVVSLGLMWLSLNAPLGLAVVCWLLVVVLQGLAMRINGTCITLLVQKAAEPGREGSAFALRSLTAEGAIFFANTMGGWIVALPDGREWIWLIAIPFVCCSLLPIGRKR